MTEEEDDEIKVDEGRLANETKKGECSLVGKLHADQSIRK